MAHPCIDCGGECYCHGDIDDAMVSKTPKNCTACGCQDFYEPDEEADYGEWPEDDEV